MLALGFKPIATTEWYGEQPHAVWPWAQAALGDAKPTVLSNADGFQFEKIATLRPDLIIGTNSGMQRADYEKLSAIAPTIAAAKGSTDYFSPWDQQTELIAKALGKEAEGRALVRSIKDRYAKVAGRAPGVRGQDDHVQPERLLLRQHLHYPAGLNTEFLTYLGLRDQPEDHRAGREAGRAGRRLGRAARRARRRRDPVRHGEAERHPRAGEGPDVQPAQRRRRAPRRCSPTACSPGRSTSSAR